MVTGFFKGIEKDNSPWFDISWEPTFAFWNIHLPAARDDGYPDEMRGPGAGLRNRKRDYRSRNRTRERTGRVTWILMLPAARCQTIDKKRFQVTGPNYPIRS